MAALMTPKSLGESAYRLLVGAFLAVVALWLLYAFVSGKFYRWQAEGALERAKVAEQSAANSQANANSANAGAANATLTRGRTDEFVIDVRGLGEAAASRIEASQPKAAADDTLDDDVMAELDEAEDRIAKQANRLRKSR